MSSRCLENTDSETIRDALAAHIKPLLPGAELSGPYPGGITPSFFVCYDTAHRLRVYISPDLKQFFVFERTHPFSEDERVFLEGIVREIQDTALAGKSPFDAAAQLVTTAVTRFAAPDFAETVARVIRAYEALHTSGEMKTAHTTGIRLMRQKKTQSNFFELAEKGLVKTLGTSPDTLVVIDAKGAVCTIEKIPPVIGESRRGQDIFAPVAHAGIAAWANSGRKTVVRMTDDGTILLFSRGRLLFAKKNGLWRSPPHTLANLASVPESIEGVAPETVKALYLTALDLISGNVTSRIGLVRTSVGRRLPGIGKEKPRIPTGNSMKNAKLLAGMIQAQKFHEIPRAIRAEVCSLGGILFLDGQGSILGLDLSEENASEGLNGSREGKRQAFPGSAYMELLNRDGNLNLRLAIY